MRWRVGNGEDIRVWSDPWLPGTQTRKVLSSRGNSPIDLRVGALIDHTTRRWNEQLIATLLAPFEVDRVLGIPLSHRMPSDNLCWDLENNGEFGRPIQHYYKMNGQVRR